MKIKSIDARTKINIKYPVPKRIYDGAHKLLFQSGRSKSICSLTKNPKKNEHPPKREVDIISHKTDPMEHSFSFLLLSVFLAISKRSRNNTSRGAAICIVQ